MALSQTQIIIFAGVVMFFLSISSSVIAFLVYGQMSTEESEPEESTAKESTTKPQPPQESEIEEQPQKESEPAESTATATPPTATPPTATAPITNPTTPPKTECIWSGWGEWQECSTACGGGKKVRQRELVSGDCPIEDFEFADCNTQACPAPAPTNAIKTVDGKCWDIPNNEAKGGANIQIYDCNGSDAQKFLYSADGTIKHIPSGLCVDIPGGNRTNGNKLILWDCNGGSNQKFTERYGSTFCSTQHRATDKCIDIPNNDTSNGSKLQIWDRNSISSAQKFNYSK
jgi:hypothetical protein